MASQTIKIGLGVANATGLSLDLYLLSGGPAIATGLVLVVDDDNPQVYSVTRVGTDSGPVIAVLKEDGSESFNSPWFGYLQNADGVYLLRLQPPSPDELNGVPTRILQLLEADAYIDQTQTPWDLVLTVKGTGGPGVGTELLRKALRDVDGVSITATDTVIGQAHE